MSIDQDEEFNRRVTEIKLFIDKMSRRYDLKGWIITALVFILLLMFYYYQKDINACNQHIIDVCMEKAPLLTLPQ